MSKLTRQDWEILRNEYGVAFMGLKKDLFDLLLDKVYGKQGSRRLVNPGRLDSTDALMFYLARTEPPIPPGPIPRKALARTEPPIPPGPQPRKAERK